MRNKSMKYTESNHLKKYWEERGRKWGPEGIPGASTAPAMFHLLNQCQEKGFIILFVITVF